jgi:hypothetical protein
MLRIALVVCLLAAVTAVDVRAEAIVEWQGNDGHVPGEVAYTITYMGLRDSLTEIVFPFAEPHDNYSYYVDSGLWTTELIQADTDSDGEYGDAVRLATSFGGLHYGQSLTFYGMTNADDLALQAVQYTIQESSGPSTNTAEVLLPARHAVGRLPGDADGDGEVTFADAWTLFIHFPMESGATWEQGDFNGDGRLDREDADIVVESYQGDRSIEVNSLMAHIPEPMTLALLGVGGLVLFRRRT